MSAMDFPSSPTGGQLFAAPNGTLYQFSATVGAWQALTDTAQTQAVTAGIQAAMSAEDNLVLNGGMQIAQRGASFSPAAGAIIYTLDRWAVTCGTGNTVSIAQLIAGPGAATIGEVEGTRWNSIQLTRTVTGSTYSFLYQNIENVRTASAQTVTVSFHVQTTNPTTGKLSFAINQLFGTGGSPSATVFSPTVLFDTVGGGSWERKVITYAVPSISGKTLGTNGDHSLQIAFGIDNAAGNQSFLFANVDIRLGTIAPAQFLRRPYQQELALCQRYYQVYRQTIASGYQVATGQVYSHFPFPVMRTTPTITPSNISYGNASGFITANVYPNNARLAATVTATGNGYGIADLTLDAEL